MSLTKCRHCDDEHVCHVGNSHLDENERALICDALLFRASHMPSGAEDAAVSYINVYKKLEPGTAAFPVIPRGQVDTEVAADVHRMGWDDR